MVVVVVLVVVVVMVVVVVGMLVVVPASSRQTKTKPLGRMTGGHPHQPCISPLVSGVIPRNHIFKSLNWSIIQIHW